MNIFEQATRLKLRFHVSSGILSVEQLWDLNRTKLATIAKNLKEEKESKEFTDLDFLDDSLTEDPILNLKFEIVKHIYLVKKEEAKTEATRKERKDEREKLLDIISRKEEESLANESIDKLKERLRKLED